MSDSREYKKNQLRSRMITTGGATDRPTASFDGDRGRQEESATRRTAQILRPIRSADSLEQQRRESEEAIKKAHRRVVRRRMIILIVLFCLVAGALGSVYWYNRFVQLESTTVVWERQMAQTEGTYTGYVSFGENILKYTRDGASYIDASGKDIWIQSYEMNSPIVAVNGNYAAIADQQGNSIYICDLAGCQGIATTVLPISKVTISASGITAAVVEDQTASHVYYYQQDGTELEIYIKGLLGSNDSQEEWEYPYGSLLLCAGQQSAQPRRVL